MAGKNHVVLVTGGATGIGFATARVLLENGASVVISGHDPAQIDGAGNALKGVDAKLRMIAADVRELAQMQKAVELALASFGKLTGLVCAAGIQIPGTVASVSEDDWASVLDVNLSGAYRACKAAIPEMEKQGGGSIVIISSVQANRGKPNGAAYIAAKGGLNALCRAMAVDHGPPNIRVNTICPGVVDTPMLRASLARSGDKKQMDALIAGLSMQQPITPGIGRVCKPEDVAKLAAFLLGDEAQYITGGEFAIDGGLAAKLAL